MSLLPLDLNEVIYTKLMADRRPPDGLLHASSHLIGPLRHALLDCAGAPVSEQKMEDDIASAITLMTGTMWHSWLGDTLESNGVPVMREVDVTPGLPAGWSGTADFLVWNPEHKGFVLVDLKTTKAAGLRYIKSGGPKPEHVWQASLYWFALRNMHIPMVKEIGVYYLPKEQLYGKDGPAVPILCEFAPLPAGEVKAVVEERSKARTEYLDSLPPAEALAADPSLYLTDKLAPVPEREQKLRKRGGSYELVLQPHWSSMFCRYDDDLCNCGEDGTTKVGEFSDGLYFPRKGYEQIIPEVTP